MRFEAIREVVVGIPFMQPERVKSCTSIFRGTSLATFSS